MPITPGIMKYELARSGLYQTRADLERRLEVVHVHAGAFQFFHHQRGGVLLADERGRRQRRGPGGCVRPVQEERHLGIPFRQADAVVGRDDDPGARLALLNQDADLVL
jgi:hypothetical protein